MPLKLTLWKVIRGLVFGRGWLIELENGSPLLCHRCGIAMMGTCAVDVYECFQCGAEVRVIAAVKPTEEL